MGICKLTTKVRILAHMILAGSLSAIASSTTFDGVITSISQNSVALMANYQPYSSPGVLCVLGKGGTKNLPLAGNSKHALRSLFIDDIPVSPDEFRAAVKVGTRLFTHENRSHFFWGIASVRENNNHFGEIVSHQGDKLRLRRRTMEKGQHENACPESPEYLFTDIEVQSNALIYKDGKRSPLSETLNAGLRVLIQSPREKMRVELIPPKANDFHDKVTLNSKFLGDRMMIYGTMLGIFTSDIKKDSYNVGGYHFYGKSNESNTSSTPDSQVVKMQNSNGAQVYNIAGLGLGQGIFKKPIREVGDIWWTIDGFWTDVEWKNIVKPGKWFLGRTTRARSVMAPSISSEDPIVWGIIEKVEGNTVTLTRPSLNGLFEPKISFKIDTDAEYYRLGVDTDMASTLKPSHFIRIYAKRPQTIMLNDGKHVPEGIDPDRVPSNLNVQSEGSFLRSGKGRNNNLEQIFDAKGRLSLPKSFIRY